MLNEDRPGLRLEQIVRDVLSKNAFQVSTVDENQRDPGFDFAISLGPHSWAVEVKYYRTARAQMSLVEAAAIRLVSVIAKHKELKGMLVVSCSLSPEQRFSLEEKYNLVFVDRSDLLLWSAELPSVSDEIISLLEERNFPSDLPTGRKIDQIVSSFDSAHPAQDFPDAEMDTKGTDLCHELRSLKSGKENWGKYEELCERVLRYLFPNDLHGWHRQKRTVDGLNRFDYVCRVKDTTDFWNFLLNHLNSRYVLFEFKNYAGAVKQGQILTTEKYLLEKALRCVAIMFSRTGCDKNANKMAQGAMREGGKLILVLDDDKICQMLHMKERGEDPTDLLFDTADHFLLSLPR